MSEPRFTFNDTTDSRPLVVPKGLFLLRYVSSPDGVDAPEISVTVPAGSDIELIDAADSFAGRGEALLGMPGDAVVLRCGREGPVFITVLSSGKRSRRQAHVGLERVTNASRHLEDSVAHAAPHAVGVEPEELVEIRAHVANRGDVTAKGGQWICGPQFPMAIEGIALNLAHSLRGLDIVTTASISERGRIRSAPSSSGRFVGTRGRAAPLVGLSFTLTGPLASHYMMSCEALFLGAAIVSRAGTTVELKGPTGLEPLVGLRLSLAPAMLVAHAPRSPRASLSHATFEEPHRSYELAEQPAKDEQEPTTAGVVLPTKISATGSTGHVRVFRTSRSRPALN